jgi:hypothetical protein
MRNRRLVFIASYRPDRLIRPGFVFPRSFPSCTWERLGPRSLASSWIRQRSPPKLVRRKLSFGEKAFPSATSERAERAERGTSGSLGTSVTSGQSPRLRTTRRLGARSEPGESGRRNPALSGEEEVILMPAFLLILGSLRRRSWQ